MTQPLPPGAFAKALQDKRKAERRRRLLVWGIAGGVLVAALLVGYLVFFSPAFAARQVVVTGTDLLDADDVRTAAAVQLDVPLARQDLAGIEARVRALPPVKDAKVGVGLPDTVEIAITERTVAFQRRNAGEIEWIDAEGVVFHHSKKPSKNVIQAEAPRADERLLRDIATVATSLPKGVAKEVVQLRAAGVDQISLALTDGRSVTWGDASESALKAEVLAALLTQEARVYDVSSPRTPTTRG
ncbi:MAG: FtsQ-type POTRA domain-containing protein [Tessaracoccus sp.]|uniref:cell division protein FtsQ/DivIB n=1 Tax=Tessaracoccus sp. TaxID=1971211 RepID=UPI001ED532DA|nr:FtsQ-type POTRA domain-containing protein [Tessaracoccus sp.]MBK7821564.1 FtsQ-type POTRA domain-containing protein [Tessaracoccus sp.]